MSRTKQSTRYSAGIAAALLTPRGWPADDTITNKSYARLMLVSCCTTWLGMATKYLHQCMSLHPRRCTRLPKKDANGQLPRPQQKAAQCHVTRTCSAWT